MTNGNSQAYYNGLISGLKEGLASQRVMDTSAISHCLKRYETLLNERIACKEMLNNSPIIIKANEE